MKVIAKKTKHLSVFIVRLIFGMLMMIGMVLGLPITLMCYDITLFTNLPFVLVILGIMLLFALIAYFGFVKPYQLYRKLPEIQAETDGEYLYIHSKKEAKIPLSAMDGVYVTPEIPNYMSSQYFVHMFSEFYGDVEIDIPEYGEYKLYFVVDAIEVANTIVAHVDKALNG